MPRFDGHGQRVGNPAMKGIAVRKARDGKSGRWEASPPEGAANPAWRGDGQDRYGLSNPRSGLLQAGIGAGPGQQAGGAMLPGIHGHEHPDGRLPVTAAQPSRDCKGIKKKDL